MLGGAPLGTLPLGSTGGHNYAVEALHVGGASALVTWTGVEVLRTTSTIPTISAVTWMGAEVAHVGVASERITWVGAEVAHAGAAADRVSWLGVEVLRSVKDRPADSGWVCLIAA
jgi:hypothetical protein